MLTKQEREKLIDALVSQDVQLIQTGQISLDSFLREGWVGYGTLPDDLLLERARAEDSDIDLEDLGVTPTPQGGMNDYRVTWEIDLSATSPKEAAKRAMYFQRPQSTAHVFVVTDSYGTAVQVDLDEDQHVGF